MSILEIREYVWIRMWDSAFRSLMGLCQVCQNWRKLNLIYWSLLDRCAFEMGLTNIDFEGLGYDLSAWMLMVVIYRIHGSHYHSRITPLSQSCVLITFIVVVRKWLAYTQEIVAQISIP